MLFCIFAQNLEYSKHSMTINLSKKIKSDKKKMLTSTSFYLAYILGEYSIIHAHVIYHFQ